MLRKIKNGFIGFMCVLWVTGVWLIAAMDHSEFGGAELNGFLAFLLWIVSICLIVKVNAIMSAVGSTVILFIIRMVRFGADIGRLEELEQPISILLVCLVLGKLFFSSLDKAEKESESKRKRIKDAEARGEACCPWCGSVSIQYYALGIPYEEYDSIRHKYAQYHCNSCGREW